MAVLRRSVPVVHESQLLSSETVSVIAEIGINHDGSEAEAEWLVRSAAISGVHGVKFQYRNLERSYAPTASEIGDELLKREIERNFLTVETITRLAALARNEGLLAGLSFFTSDDVQDFPQLSQHFDFLKIPSVELSNSLLVDAALSYEMPTLISTGAHSENEVRGALERIADSPWWIPLHCVSNYPTDPRNSNIRYVQHLSDLYPQRSVGFSSHEREWEWSLLAVAFGATTIERHITRDVGKSGLDHSSSSTPEEFRRLVALARQVEAALGVNGPRVMNQGEVLNAQNLGRSLYLTRPVSAGEKLSAELLMYASPRLGRALHLAEIEGRPAVRAGAAGEPVSRVLHQAPDASEDLIRFANDHSIGIPVRPRDMQQLFHALPLNVLEFHLTFGDLELPSSAFTPVESGCFSVHAPDYLSSTVLLDPFSDSAITSHDSRMLLRNVARIAVQLQSQTGNSVPIISSFPTVGRLGADYLERLREFVERFKEEYEVSLLPQWLPPFAWYFGGTFVTEGLNSTQDLETCRRLELPICLDTAHLIMSCHHEGVPLELAIREALPLARHLHLADASGVDSEGVALGSGALLGSGTVRSLLETDCRVILETWQGHLDGGAGFVHDLTTLRRAWSDPIAV